MTISSTTRKVGPIAGNGVAQVFAFPFKIFQPEDMRAVWLDTSNGNAGDLVLTEHYTVSLNADQNANPGGSITLWIPLPVGITLTLSSDQPNLQPADITNQGGFYPEVITAALDRLEIDIQELQEQADRSLRYPISDPPLQAETIAAPQRANKFLYFGDDGGIDLVTKEPLRVKFFAGALLGTIDGINCTFTVSNAGSPLGEAPLQMFLWKNFPQIPGVGYTSGPGVDQITFTYAPEPGDTLYAQGQAYL